MRSHVYLLTMVRAMAKMDNHVNVTRSDHITTRSGNNHKYLHVCTKDPQWCHYHGSKMKRFLMGISTIDLMVIRRFFVGICVVSLMVLRWIFLVEIYVVDFIRYCWWFDLYDLHIQEPSSHIIRLIWSRLKYLWKSSTISKHVYNEMLLLALCVKHLQISLHKFFALGRSTYRGEIFWLLFTYSRGAFFTCPSGTPFC